MNPVHIRQHNNDTCHLGWLPLGYGRKEGNVLFNNAFNTFHLWLYGIGQIARAKPAAVTTSLLLPISSKGSFICTISQTGQHIPWSLLHQS